MRGAAHLLSVERSVRVHVLIDTLGVGGAEVLLADFAAVASREGVELSVGYLKEVGAHYAAVRLRAAGVEPRCVAIPPRLGLEAFRRVRRHLAHVRPELVHTHLGYSDLLGGPAARSLGLPTVATIHSHAPPPTPRERVKARMMTAARRVSAARVIAVSESARAAYLAGGAAPERVVVVHNGILGRAEPGAGGRVRAELGLGAGDLVVAMVSALRPEKGHDVALDIVRASLERFPLRCAWSWSATARCARGSSAPPPRSATASSSRATGPTSWPCSRRPTCSYSLRAPTRSPPHPRGHGSVGSRRRY